jgi:hypothetical protein
MAVKKPMPMPKVLKGILKKEQKPSVCPPSPASTLVEEEGNGSMICCAQNAKTILCPPKVGS